jgi:beta-glucosidase-like glycosyl hydrolase
MGSFSHFAVAEFPLFSLKNGFYHDIVDLIFLKEDYMEETLPDPDENEETEFRGYKQTVKVCRERLEIYGHNLLSAKQNFKEARKHAREESELGFYYNISFERYLELIGIIVKNKIRSKPETIEKDHVANYLIECDLVLYETLSMSTMLTCLFSLLDDDIHRWAMTAKDSADNAFSTAWPVGTLLASSWDTTLIHKVGVAFGEEIKAYGIDFILGPGANIHRNPLGGRNFEYYSEDPLISGSSAAAIINGIQSQGVGATLKHFAANNQETNRNSVNEIISERALREIYLRNFEIAVKKSQPWAIMSSYNLVNGTYTSESNDLITKILRDDWGFKGFVMTDWFGGKDAVAQIQAGNNLLMPGSPAQIKALTDAVKSGKLSEAVLDKNVEGILNVLLKTLTAKGYDYPNKADLKAHAQVARMAAAESMVLLKNTSDALPAHSGASVALFGTHGYDLIAGGTGIRHTRPRKADESGINPGSRAAISLMNFRTPFSRHHSRSSVSKAWL